MSKGADYLDEIIKVPTLTISSRDESKLRDAMDDWETWHIKHCPVNYRQSDLARLNPQFLEACNAWQMGTQGLGLFGATGSTKTRCMWELIRRVSKPWPKEVERFHWGGEPRTQETEIQYFRHGVSIVRDVDFARECALQFKDGHDMKQLFAWKKCDLLFIDDLGKCRITERVQTELFDLIDFRTSNGMPILWTSNHDAKALSKRFASPDDSAPILRRLVEECQIVEATK